MKAYFDPYSEDCKDILSRSKGEDAESASFFSSQKVSHLASCYSNNHLLQTILDSDCGVGMSLRPLQHQLPEAEIARTDPFQSSLDVAAKEHADCIIYLLPFCELNELIYARHFYLNFISRVYHHIVSSRRPLH